MRKVNEFKINKSALINCGPHCLPVYKAICKFVYSNVFVSLARRTTNKTYLNSIETFSCKTGSLESFTCDLAGSVYECEMWGRGMEMQVLKTDAQSASYLWSGKFFLAHLLFVLNVIFAGPH